LGCWYLYASSWAESSRKRVACDVFGEVVVVVVAVIRWLQVATSDRVRLVSLKIDG